jgi:hypothetical protein
MRPLELTLQCTVLYLGIIFSCQLNFDAGICRCVFSKSKCNYMVLNYRLMFCPIYFIEIK